MFKKSTLAAAIIAAFAFGTFGVTSDAEAGHRHRHRRAVAYYPAYPAPVVVRHPRRAFYGPPVVRPVRSYRRHYYPAPIPAPGYYGAYSSPGFSFSIGF